MSKPTAHQLAERAVKAGLIPESQRAKLWDEIGMSDISVEDFISSAIAHDYLTNWQVAQLVDGKTDGFFVGDYKLLYLIQCEPFTRTYRAEYKNMQDNVAIKILRPRFRHDSAAYARFQNEAEGQGATVLAEKDVFYFVTESS